MKSIVCRIAVCLLAEFAVPANYSTADKTARAYREEVNQDSP